MSSGPSPLYGESGFERRQHDAYWTEEWVTRAALAVPWIAGRMRDRAIWEPACGRGDIAKVLEKAGYTVVSTDIADHGFGMTGCDFFAEGEALGSVIFTNPPYDVADDFVRHALRLTEPVRGMVVMLLRHDWDAAKRRVPLFTMPAYTGKLTLTRRPRWDLHLTEEERIAERRLGRASPRKNFAWFVWDWTTAAFPPTAWWQP